MTKKQKKVLIRIIIAALLTAVFCFLPAENPYVRLVLFLIPYLVIGYDILRKAVLGILHGEVFDENFLMAVATVGAIALGEYVEGTAVMLFYQIGELFQSYAVGRSRRNITALMDIRPDYANIEQDGVLVQVDPEEVEPGTIITVQPGEKVPIDGVIVEGASTLNTSALTGESLPREAAEGDEVISGCVNMSGVLHIRTTKAFGESTVSKILDLVENSSMKKSRSENFITRFARYYTPAVCLGALALAVVPPLVKLLTGQPAGWSQWVIRALTTLVISCPCALVISGVFEVTHVIPVSGSTSEGAGEALLEAAVYAEHYSNHPISRSLREAYGRPVDAARISDVEEIGGHGVTARVDGRQVAAGNRKLMERLRIAYEIPEQIGTEVHVAVDGSYAGYILIADVVKPNAKAAVAGVKAAGVEKVVMLTGDAKAVADAVAAELGVDVVKSELLPADKVAEVEALLAEKGRKEKLAFVGDGINDAPVLSRADLGIAMGALGADAAIEAADIVLMDDNPEKIATAIGISRKTIRIVQQNIVFALAVKFICLGLGAVGTLNMWWAIFADVGVMIIAVLNATRALYYKEARH